MEGSAKDGTLAVSLANLIREQSGRMTDQQIVLMSSIQTVRELRIRFRKDAALTGAAFAFVGKPDLDEKWKVKAHLGMLERARPYAPAFTQYRSDLEVALGRVKEDLLSLVDDLDIGDYAFLQSRALMNDGHPLGDYIFWLLSSQFTALAFERDDMRTRQKDLDSLEFVGESFATTEPSAVVANMLHSALVSSSTGALGPHPRASKKRRFKKFPLVQLGDVFLDKERTKAVVIMSAACDLAFSPMPERHPDGDTPVMLVPGKPIKLRDANNEQKHRTDGLLHRDEVYRIGWDFSKYRSVNLGGLEKWLKTQGYDTTDRDRLRPLFALKLQQEFGAHLLRVGPPLLPPVTSPAAGTIFVFGPNKEIVRKFDRGELMLTRFDEKTTLRVTPKIAGALKAACEDLLPRLEAERDKAKEKAKGGWEKKMESLSAQINDDTFWIELLSGVELNAKGSEKPQGPLAFILASEPQDAGKPRVVLQIEEDPKGGQQAKRTVEAISAVSEIAAVSGA